MSATPASLYNQGEFELNKAGYRIGAGSGVSDESVVVLSREILPDSYGAAAASFIATLLDGVWIIQRSASIKG